MHEARPAQPEKLLEIQNVSKSYEGASVLAGVNLDVRRGEAVAILGSSGCGKSTLLRCVNGLESICAGQIFLRGEPLHTPRADWRLARQKIGMVFQHYELFPHMTVLDNILLGPVRAQGRDRRGVADEARALLSRVGLEDKLAAYPRQLSGGQKQRAAIVRALCMRPDIMLFDEATASLDPEMSREVLNVIRELAKDGMTMLIVTHELAFARAVANRIAFIDRGSILETGSPETFFSGPATERARRFLRTYQEYA